MGVSQINFMGAYFTYKPYEQLNNIRLTCLIFIILMILLKENTALQSPHMSNISFS